MTTLAIFATLGKLDLGPFRPGGRRNPTVAVSVAPVVEMLNLVRRRSDG